MMLERLKNLRVLDGRDCWLEAQLEHYPHGSVKWKELSEQLEGDRKEREMTHQWIEKIPVDRVANVVILRYIKHLRWHEIANLIGGLTASGCKMCVLRYIRAVENQEANALPDEPKSRGESSGNDTAEQRERNVDRPV